MTCVLQKKITTQKFLNYDFRNCIIKKCLIKTDVFFDVINQSHLYGQKIDKFSDILKVLYSFLINTQIDTNKNIIEKSAIAFSDNSCFMIEQESINEVIIIREIFNVCERNTLKLWIEIEIEQGLLIFKDD